MSTTVTGTVANGVVVPNSPLPEGARVEVIVVLPEKSEPQFGSAPALTEFDRQLDELSLGLPALPLLPPEFARADLYADHD